MIEEQYVSFETAKLAKEKGFDIPTRYGFSERRSLVRVDTSDNWNQDKELYSRPTQSLLARWLRENYGLFIEITIDFMRLITEDNPTKYYPMYYYKIINLKNSSYVNNRHEYYSYEEAMEDGLQEALKLLP